MENAAGHLGCIAKAKKQKAKSKKPPSQTVFTDTLFPPSNCKVEKSGVRKI